MNNKKMNNKIPLPAIEMMIKQYIMCQKYVSNGDYREALPYAWGLLGLLKKYSIHINDKEIKKAIFMLEHKFREHYKQIVSVDIHYWEVRAKKPSLFNSVMELYSCFLCYSMMALADLGAYEYEETSKLFNLTELLSGSNDEIGDDEDDEDDAINDAVQYINKGGRGWLI
jgi:hypothetical protein